MPKKCIYTVADFVGMIDTAADLKTVTAVVIVAIGQASNKNLSPYALAGVLRKASDKIYSISTY